MGSYKCISITHSQKATKVLREEDYDSENEDDDNDDDYGDEITEIPRIPRCEDGFKRNENLECVGKCFRHIVYIMMYFLSVTIYHAALWYKPEDAFCINKLSVVKEKIEIDYFCDV